MYLWSYKDQYLNNFPYIQCTFAEIFAANCPTSKMATETVQPYSAWGGGGGGLLMPAPNLIS